MGRLTSGNSNVRGPDAGIAGSEFNAVGRSREPPARNISRRSGIGFLRSFHQVFERAKAAPLQRGAASPSIDKQKPVRKYPGRATSQRKNLNQDLLERDTSRFQGLCLRQIDRQNTLVDAGRNPVGID